MSLEAKIEELTKVVKDLTVAISEGGVSAPAAGKAGKSAKPDTVKSKAAPASKKAKEPEQPPAEGSDVLNTSAGDAKPAPDEQELLAMFLSLGKEKGRPAIEGVLSEMGVTRVQEIPAERRAEAAKLVGEARNL